MIELEKITGIRAALYTLQAIFLKNLKHYTRNPGSFIGYLLLPFLFSFLILGVGRFLGGATALLAFAARTGTSDVVLYEILGAAVWITSWVVVEDVGVTLRDEQVQGTLEQNFLAPVNRFLLLVGVSLTDVVIAAALFLMVVGVTLLVAAPSAFPGLLPAFLMLLIGLVPLFGLGFIFSGFIIKFKEPYVFVQAINLIFGILTGTYYPVTVLPYWVQLISRVLPQTYVIDGMRRILIADQTLVNLYGSVLTLIVLALLYPILGYGFFRFLERKAGVTGDLAKY